MSVLYAPVTTPKSAACRTRFATLALQISFLLGRQLVLGQEPPIQRRSTTAVFCPDCAKCQARYFPPSPLPMIMFWYVSIGMYLLLGSLAGFNLCPFVPIYPFLPSERRARASADPKRQLHLQFLIHARCDLTGLLCRVSLAQDLA